MLRQRVRLRDRTAGGVAARRAAATVARLPLGADANTLTIAQRLQQALVRTEFGDACNDLVDLLPIAQACADECFAPCDVWDLRPARRVFRVGAYSTAGFRRSIRAVRHAHRAGDQSGRVKRLMLYDDGMFVLQARLMR